MKSGICSAMPAVVCIKVLRHRQTAPPRRLPTQLKQELLDTFYRLRAKPCQRATAPVAIATISLKLKLNFHDVGFLFAKRWHLHRARCRAC